MPRDNQAGVTTAVILAGGLGTRLRPVCPDRPKPMVPVLGRPFLDYLIEYISHHGISDVVISAGYLGDQIESFFDGSRYGMAIRYVRELNPMGTGGALAYVVRQIQLRSHFLALNGDSIAPFSLESMVQAMRAGADASIVGVRVADSSRFGSLAVDQSRMLAGFREKSEAGSGAVVNAGIYLLSPTLLTAEAAPAHASIERDYFPRWLAKGKRIAVVPSDGPFIDIGTPESLAAAPGFIRECRLFSLSV